MKSDVGQISRRGVIKGSIAVAAGASMASVTSASTNLASEDGIDSKMSEATKKLYRAQLDQTHTNAATRLKTVLPEGSEPYFMIHPVPFTPVKGSKSR